MAEIIIPTPPQGRFRWRLRFQLEAIWFRFQFTWNIRAGAWFLEMGSDQNVSQVRGIKMNLGTDKLQQYRYAEVPQGSLDVVDSSLTSTEPTLDSFGDTVLLRYTEVEATEPVIPELTEQQ